jgi:TorA maturation chaperone TorD
MQTTGISAMEAKATADVYRFLAAVLTSHPTRQSVDAVCRIATDLGIQCAGELDVTRLDREYMALFVVPNPRYVAPYESVFRDRWLLPVGAKAGVPDGAKSVMIKGLVMGESTLAVQGCYHLAGVAPKEDLPDHIANELHFMGYLWERTAESPADEAAMIVAWRTQFRDEHILRWIGQLRDRLAESDDMGYYGVVLQIAETVLQDDI